MGLIWHQELLTRSAKAMGWNQIPQHGCELGVICELCRYLQRESSYAVALTALIRHPGYPGPAHGQYWPLAVGCFFPV